MDTKYIPILTDAFKSYYSVDEIVEMCKLFDIKIVVDETDSSLMKFSRQLITKIEHDNNRRYLEALVPSLLSRAKKGVAETRWDKQEFHRTMDSNLEDLSSQLGKSKLPEEISVPESSEFTAKSKVRELLGSAETEIIIVDNYVGLSTIDCLRDIKHPVKLLTGQCNNSIESDFNRGIKEFISEGYKVEVRQHPKLHDRFILFNDKCWIVGSSLKHAGRKRLNIIECVDIKNAIINEIEQKWKEASKYTIKE
jgi:hypothetical protein